MPIEHRGTTEEHRISDTVTQKTPKTHKALQIYARIHTTYKKNRDKHTHTNTATFNYRNNTHTDTDKQTNTRTDTTNHTNCQGLTKNT